MLARHCSSFFESFFLHKRFKVNLVDACRDFLYSLNVCLTGALPGIVSSVQDHPILIPTVLAQLRNPQNFG
jgi:hypothetical protein